MTRLKRLYAFLGLPNLGLAGAQRQRNPTPIAQIALAAALALAANAALGGGWAYMHNTECEGDDPTLVADRNAALDLEALSYKEDGSEECEDISNVETVVVIGTRGGGGGEFSIGSGGGGGGTDTQWDGLSFSYGGGGGRGGNDEEEEDVVERRTGLCVRPIDLPLSTPASILAYLPKHHDVRTDEITAVVPYSPTTRGFFAVNMALAVAAAIQSLRHPILFTGYVEGEVRDSAHTAGPCTMEVVTDSKFHAVLKAINAPNTYKYHLLKYNCQHWAAEKLAS